MTVPVTVERNNYTGNGTTATYAYGFRITAQTHLKVTVADSDGAETELTIGTDYTVTGVGVKTGGNIVLVDNGQAWIDVDGYLETGWDISIRHFVPLTQSTDIRNQGTFYPEIHEDAFDYLMWVCKQQQDEINRSVKAGETVTGVTPVFPAPEDGKSLVWSGTSGAMINSDLKGDTGATGATGPQGPAGADGEDGIIMSIVAGTNVTVDDTDPANPVVSASTPKATGAEIDTGTDDAKFATAKAIADSGLLNGSVGVVGSPVSKTVGTIYQAGTDGIVCSTLIAADGTSITRIEGFSDANSNPVLRLGASDVGPNRPSYSSISFPVSKGNYYKIIKTTESGTECSPSMHFIPIA